MAGGFHASADDGGITLPPPPLTAAMMWLSFLAALGGFLFGFDTSVISGALLLIKRDFDLSTFQQELVVSLTVAGAFIGALVGGAASGKFGRKPAIVSGSVVFIAGAAVLTFANNWQVLAAGRLIVGIGVGIASATVPTYITESAPAHLRGTLTVVNTVCISTGQLLANVVDAALSKTPHGWRYMFAVSAIPAAIQFVGFFFLPESPRYLVSVGKVKEARAVLQRLRGIDYSVDNELLLIEKATTSKTGGIAELLRTRKNRHILFLACMLQVINQFTGINCIMYYSSSILKMAGIASDTMTMWISAGLLFLVFGVPDRGVGIDTAFVAFTILGLILVDKAGRRPLLFWSCICVLFSTLVIAQSFYLADTNSPKVDLTLSSLDCQYSTCSRCISNSHCGFCDVSGLHHADGTCVVANTTFTECTAKKFHSKDDYAVTEFCPNPYSWLAITGLCLYLSSFAFGITSMPWIINSEIFPTHLRAAGNAYATSVNWICNLAVSLSFLSLTESITEAGAFWLYGGFGLLSIIYVYYHVPETKGLTLEEMDELFETRIRVEKQNRKYYSPLN